MNDRIDVARADLHCHSTASQIAKLGVSRALGLPECATPPEEAYELAKRRGMDFVTLTDHDVIDGAVELASRHDDAFVSVELTAGFRDEPQAVHVLCWGITPEQFDDLRGLASDVEDVAAYLDEHAITSALAHPFFAVGAPLLARHRRRLAQLFGVWETRNGSRAPELNAPAAVYVDTHGGTGTGGSDDHAGVDIGRTWTATPPAADWRAFLGHVRGGRASAGGRQGSAAKWAHAALAIATRVLGDGAATPDPGAVWRMASGLMEGGDAIGAGLAAGDAAALLAAWRDALGLDGDVLAELQAEGFSHSGLERRARRVHERRLRAAVGRGPAGIGDLFAACVPAIPYAPAAAILARERVRLAPREAGDPRRVALVADGIGGVHGVARTVEIVRELGVPGFEVDVVGTDPGCDRRLGAVAELDLGGLAVGVPSLPAVVDVLAEGAYDIVHVCAPGPAGVAAALLARVMGLPLVGSHHTELEAYARHRGADAALMRLVLARFYGACDRVLSPSAAADRGLLALGIDPARIGRWDRGVDTTRFAPRPVEGNRDRVDVLYAGRLAPEKGLGLLAEAIELARARDPRIRLVLAGDGPERAALERRLGDAVVARGWLEGDALADAYAAADVFCFASQTDTFGQVVLEAQASGLPVVAVDAGGPAELVDDGRSGVLCPPDAAALADAVVHLARSRAARARLARGGLAAVRGRTWEASIGQLAAGWSAALAREEVRRAA